MAELSQSEAIKAKVVEVLALQKVQLTENVYHLDKDNLIGVGVFAHVYRIDGERVRKVPAPNSNDLDLAMKSIRREGEIYGYLGDHPRVVKCLATGDLFIDLEYAPCGHIESYLRNHPDTSNEYRIRWAREATEAVAFVHSKGITHADIAARQFLLDSQLHSKISDFGFSSFADGDVLGFENSSHQLPRDLDCDIPSTVQSELFALGSTIYEIMTGKRPYEDVPDDAITNLYSEGTFPDVTSILCGVVIMSCWKCCFTTAEEILEHFIV